MYRTIRIPLSQTKICRPLPEFLLPTVKCKREVGGAQPKPWPGDRTHQLLTPDGLSGSPSAPTPDAVAKDDPSSVQQCFGWTRRPRPFRATRALRSADPIGSFHLQVCISRSARTSSRDGEAQGSLTLLFCCLPSITAMRQWAVLHDRLRFGCTSHPSTGKLYFGCASHPNMGKLHGLLGQQNVVLKYWTFAGRMAFTLQLSTTRISPLTFKVRGSYGNMSYCKYYSALFGLASSQGFSADISSRRSSTPRKRSCGWRRSGSAETDRLLLPVTGLARPLPSGVAIGTSSTTTGRASRGPVWVCHTGALCLNYPKLLRQYLSSWQLVGRGLGSSFGSRSQPIKPA